MMTSPASAIKDEVRMLVEAQIETFGQPTALTPSQLRELHYRSEKISTLCQELNRISDRQLSANATYRELTVKRKRIPSPSG